MGYPQKEHMRGRRERESRDSLLICSVLCLLAFTFSHFPHKYSLCIHWIWRPAESIIIIIIIIVIRAEMGLTTELQCQCRVRHSDCRVHRALLGGSTDMLDTVGSQPGRRDTRDRGCQDGRDGSLRRCCSTTPRRATGRCDATVCPDRRRQAAWP